jgi:hypothetical protein
MQTSPITAPTAPEPITGLAALTPVRVEGWILFTGESTHWIRDLDLAERAELKNAHKLRALVKAAIEDGALTILLPGENGQGPLVRTDKTPELDSTAFQRAELIVKSVGLMSPAVSPEAKDTMLARAVALLTGQPSTPLLPALPPSRWRRPSEMARELGVSESAVGRAITALSFREQAEHRRSILDQKRHSEGQVVCYLWSETVFEALQRHFEQVSITA